MDDGAERADVPESAELLVEQLRRERQIDEVFADLEDLGGLLIAMQYLDRLN